MRHPAVGVVLALAGLTGGGVAAGQTGAPGLASGPASSAATAPVPAPASAPSDAERLEQARALFRSGVAMLNTGDYERALDYFLRSREAYPSPPNTINAALCLDRLGRYDESLELYETALATLADKLDAQDSASISAATTQLLRKVAKIDVSANVSGTVVVDGRQRGTLPLRAPLRALPGTHVVRVVKDGYRTFETTVEVRSGEGVHVDARLEPLEAAGQLRIEDPGHDGADVMVDGAVVGQSPWEGTLGPGSHAVWSRAGEIGSAPTSVVVLQGQTALVRLHSGPLGPPVRIEVRPDTATLTLSGVAVTTGAFEIRLPAGQYQLEAKEPGYFSSTMTLPVEAGSSAPPVRVAMALKVDPSDPRWPRPVEQELGKFWAGAFGGVGWGPTMGSAVEAGCPAVCSGRPSVLAFAAGARAGFRFRFQTSIELSAGYAALDLSSSRTRTEPFDKGRFTATFDFDDQVRLAGPLLGIGASHRLRLVGDVMLVPRVTVGVLFGNVRNPVTGSVSTGPGDTAPVQIVGAGNEVGAIRTVLGPELGVTVPWKGFELGLAVQTAFFLGPDVDFTYGAAEVPPNQCGTNPGAAGCTPVYEGIAGERAIGPFYVVLPVASVGREF